MLTRRLLLSSLRLQSPINPPPFLLPFRAAITTTTTNTATPSPPPPPASSIFSHPLTPSTSPPPASPSPPPPLSTTISTTAIATNPFPPSPPPLLPALLSQPPHYILAHLHQRPYLLTPGDILRLPFQLPPTCTPGTTLRLTKASILGSRDYTLRGAPWIDTRWFVCRVRVVGVEGEPMRVVEKTKRRQRRVKRVESKGRFSVVRVLEVRGRGEGEMEREEGMVGGVVGEADLGGAVGEEELGDAVGEESGDAIREVKI